jgi:serine protease Do
MKQHLKKMMMPLAVVFSLAAGGAAMADDNDAELAFQCNAPDLSSMSLPDRIETLMPSNVFVSNLVSPAPGAPPQASGLGSGFIVDSERGYILTNNHVIDGAAEIRVTFYDDTTINNLGQEITARLLGVDETLDLAVLQIDFAGPLSCVTLGDSDQVRRADQASAIGNPLGQAFTFTQGYISHTQRSTDGGSGLYDFFQTDAAINRGNSGGGLYNIAGEVIGMNTAILSQSGGSIGIGFATQSNDIAEVANDIILYGMARRAGLGVQIQDITDDIANAMGLQSGVGVIISGVVPDGPADFAGLRASDIILEVEGVEMNTTNELARTISRFNPTDRIAIKIMRDGALQTIEVALMDREAALNVEDEDNPERTPRLPVPMP